MTNRNLRRRRRRTVPLWKCRLLWIFVIALAACDIAWVFLSLDLRADAQGTQFEKDGDICFRHLKTHYCCNPTYAEDIISNNPESHTQFNWTFYPDCYKVQINEVIK